MLSDGTFFFPGPTEVRAEVLQAMTRPMIPHRGPAFSAVFENMQRALRSIFGTTRPVYVSSSSSTGLMEAAMRGAPAGRLLAIVNGAFSARFATIARACGRDVDVLDVPWGDAVQLDTLAARLASASYAAVTVAHSETSTGALTDVRGVTRIAREHGARCLVDSVSAMGGTPFHFDDWQLDLAITGSQKALALPPGLAFLSCTPEYIEGARTQGNRGVYLDLVEFDTFAAKSQTPNTPAIPLFFAAEVQLAAILQEGLDARVARHASMAARTHEWAAGLAARHGDDYRVLAREGARSPTVTSITLPSHLVSTTVVRAVAERGFTIGTGYGANRDATIRIGHMGDHVPAALERCLAACDEALASLR